MIFGTLGIFLFIISGIPLEMESEVVVSGDSAPFTTLQLTLFYIFTGFGFICFIISIVLGILGFKTKEGSKFVRYTGLLYIPLIIIGSVLFGVMIAMSL